MKVLVGRESGSGSWTGPGDRLTVGFKCLHRSRIKCHVGGYGPDRPRAMEGMGRGLGGDRKKPPALAFPLFV